MYSRADSLADRVDFPIDQLDPALDAFCGLVDVKQIEGNDGTKRRLEDAVFVRDEMVFAALYKSAMTRLAPYRHTLNSCAPPAKLAYSAHVHLAAHQMQQGHHP